MKKITLITALLLFSLVSNAQRFKEVVMWEVETRNGDILFGISETKDGADAIMYNFQKRNANSKHDITSHAVEYKFTTVPVEHSNDNPVNRFKSLLGGKSYRIYSDQSLKDFKVAKRKGSNALVAYYTNVKQTNGKIANTYNRKTSKTITSESKSFQKVVLWEVETRIDGLLFGVSSTKDEADEIMADFQKRNANSKYDISRYPARYKFTTVSVKNQGDNPVDVFKSYTKGKQYKVLSAEDLKSIEIAKNEGLDAGVDFYVDARGADRGFVTKRLKDIMTNFDEYRIQTSKYLAATVD